ncbi:hypothetical protein ABN028_19920 [Actinopolymorpha sp. B17G11]|uniref:hypothetical protein n=1 Tax=Actinopolymorpha sp. B17G11 TaxID=3160861 RepID=UPI0032E3EAA6
MGKVQDLTLWYRDKRGFEHGPVRVTVDPTNDVALRAFLIDMIKEHDRYTHDKAVKEIANHTMDVCPRGSRTPIRKFQAAE